MPLITLSQNELHRLEAIQKLRDRRLSVVQAAEVLNLSRSQVHRLLRAYDQDGASALASKRRGRPSNRRTRRRPHPFGGRTVPGGSIVGSAYDLPIAHLLAWTSARRSKILLVTTLCSFWSSAFVTRAR